MDVCQRVFIRIIREALQDSLPLIDDHLPLPALDRGVISCYQENFGVLSTSPKECRECVAKEEALCDLRGLQYHELVVAEHYLNDF